jgi:hypothetical protein
MPSRAVREGYVMRNATTRESTSHSLRTASLASTIGPTSRPCPAEMDQCGDATAIPTDTAEGRRPDPRWSDSSAAFLARRLKQPAKARARRRRQARSQV